MSVYWDEVTGLSYIEADAGGERMSKHTPGPWHVVPKEKAEHEWVVAHGEGDSIASCEPVGPWMSDDEADANTRLIAAAPELLEALKAAVRIAEEARQEWDAAPSGMRAGKILIALSGGCPRYRKDIDAIHAAIAKAEGKPE